jgi:hypothetical protein
MYVNSDGTKSIMKADGTVQNFDRTGNPLPSSNQDFPNDPGYVPEGGITDEQLRQQEIAAQQAAQQQYDQQMLEDYQNFYETQNSNYYDPSTPYYNPDEYSTGA